MSAPPRRRSASERASEREGIAGNPKQKRLASVYDAAAGRVNSRGFIPEGPLLSSARPAFPEEVLFRCKGAPDYLYGENREEAEEDLYWANEHLNPNQTLPDSDLLKAAHTYASDFYDRATINRGQGDLRSMDGTALLALGILLEEASKHCLGEKGHLVFVEGDKDAEKTNGHNKSAGALRNGSRSRSVSKIETGDNQERKRRKLDRMDKESSPE